MVLFGSFFRPPHVSNLASSPVLSAPGQVWKLFAKSGPSCKLDYSQSVALMVDKSPSILIDGVFFFENRTSDGLGIFKEYVLQY